MLIAVNIAALSVAGHVLTSVHLLALLVIVTAASLSPGDHAVNLVLGANATVVVHLRDGSVHGLVELLEGGAAEAISTHDLGLVLDEGLDIVAEGSLPLGDADEHVLLGLVQGVDGSSFATLDALDDALGSGSIEAEHAAKDLLRVETTQHGDVSANTDTSNEELIGATAHGLDLTSDDLLDVGIALRLEEVLPLGVPSASASLLLVLFDDDRCLNTDNVDHFLETEHPVGCLAEERVNVGLRVLTMVVEEDAGGISGVDKAAIGCGDWLVDDVITNVVLEHAVLGLRFFGFCSAHL